jgi:hypothetical protein
VAHKVIITVPPPALVEDPAAPSVTVEYLPSHTLTETQQERQYGRIVKHVEKIVAIASATGSLPED